MTDELLSDAIEAIGKLRHASVIKPENVRTWLDIVMRQDPTRVLWHIRRQDGVSASSVYSHVAQLRGEFSPFKTSRELDMERQFIKAPDAPNANTLRGSLLEPLTRALVQRHYGMRTDHEALDRITAQRGHPAAPGLIGNPDDVCVGDRFQGRILPDYKMPSEETEVGDLILPHYTTQLHQYVLQAMAAGVKLKQMVLFQCHIAPELAEDLTGLAKEIADRRDNALLNGNNEESEAASREMSQFIQDTADYLYPFLQRKSKTVQVVPQSIKWDPSLAADIIKAANLADARALKGEVAPWPQQKTVELSEAGLEIGKVLARDFLRTKALAAEVEAAEAAVKKRFYQLFAGVDLKGTKLPFNGFTAYRASYLNEGAALEYLTSIGVDVSEVTTPVYNTDALVAQLRQLGVDPDQFVLRREPKEKSRQMIRDLLEGANVPSERFEASRLTLKESVSKADAHVEARASAARFALRTMSGLRQHAEDPPAHFEAPRTFDYDTPQSQTAEQAQPSAGPSLG